MEKTIYTREYAVVLRLLRQARQRARLTQVDLAKRLRITQSLFSKMERGTRRLDIVEMRNILRVLGVSLVDFAESLEQELAKRK